MDDLRDSRRNLQCVWDAIASHSSTARKVMAAYSDPIRALICTADALTRMGEPRFAAAIETRVMDIEVQARRHLDAVSYREACKGCSAWLDTCGPALWAQQRKCCPDCSHAVMQTAPLSAQVPVPAQVPND